MRQSFFADWIPGANREGGPIASDRLLKAMDLANAGVRPHTPQQFQHNEEECDN